MESIPPCESRPNFPIAPDDLLPVYRVKCKYVLKMLYRYLLSNVECTDYRESLMISQNDLAAVFLIPKSINKNGETAILTPES